MKNDLIFGELITAARTCRRYTPGFSLPAKALSDLVDMARFCPSARNLQPLRYILVSSESAKKTLYAMTSLYGKVPEEKRAAFTQQPNGYIIILGPVDITPYGLMDVGIAAQTINLAAVSIGLATCMIGAFNIQAVQAYLADFCPPALEAKLIIAVGKPDEERRLTAIPASGDSAYFKDEHDVHWVPKRSLTEAIIASL